MATTTQTRSCVGSTRFGIEALAPAAHQQTDDPGQVPLRIPVADRRVEAARWQGQWRHARRIDVCPAGAQTQAAPGDTSRRVAIAGPLDGLAVTAYSGGARISLARAASSARTNS